MIRFALTCDKAHEFDGWFQSNDAFETQQKRGLVDCPACGSRNVEKALMAPGVVTSRRKAGGPSRIETGDADGPAREPLPARLALDPERAAMMEKLREMARAVRANADYVGPDFAEEARRIHFGEVPERAIYGEAGREEVEALLEDGVPVAPIPMLPEDRN
jgi:hypothetical protein